MCSVDASAPDVWAAVRVRARKAHVCRECDRTIAPGEVYERVGTLWEGRWSTVRTCAHCRELVQWLIDLCRGYELGESLREIEEHLDPSYGLEIDPRDADILRQEVAHARQQWRNDQGALRPVPLVLQAS